MKHIVTIKAHISSNMDPKHVDGYCGFRKGESGIWICKPHEHECSDACAAQCVWNLRRKGICIEIEGIE